MSWLSLAAVQDQQLPMALMEVTVVAVQAVNV
jgi:hypothetical protein